MGVGFRLCRRSVRVTQKERVGEEWTSVTVVNILRDGRAKTRVTFYPRACQPGPALFSLRSELR